MARTVATDAEVAGFVVWAGFPPATRTIAVAVCLAESGGRIDAKNVNKDGTIDWGLWQFNSRWHPEVSTDCATSPWCATKQALRVSNGGKSWSQWSAYKNGRYVLYLGRAKVALAHPKDSNPDDFSGASITTASIPGVGKVNVGGAIADATGLGAIADTLRALTSGATWTRVFQVVVGSAMFTLGVVVLLRDFVPQATIARKVARG